MVNLTNNKTLIIAEAGVNHNGNIYLAKKMIKAAARAGADIIKFQIFKTELLLKKNTKKPNYIKKIIKRQSQFQILKRLELTYDNFKTLKKYCEKFNIEFMSSPFDLESLNFIKKLNVKRIKIASSEINNVPLIKKIGELKKKIIISTGMSDMQEIKFCLDYLLKKGTKKRDISILHCNSEYPSPFKDINLKAIETIKNKFRVQVGLSDHSIGIEIPIAAVGMGAKIIEKHVTLNKKFKGPDHQASIDFKEFNTMVKSIRNVELAIGSPFKRVSESERKNKNLVRKSIIAKNFILKGEKFSENNLITKRPGLGTPANKWDKIIGSKARKDYFKDQDI
jgi:N,N'-diacetyllegionaminate synthase